MSDPVHAAIVSLLEGIPAIGHVFPYEPYEAQADKTAKHYRYGDRLRGWWVSPIPIAMEYLASIGIGAKRNRRSEWTIIGYMEVTDGGASALALRELTKNSLPSSRRDKHIPFRDKRIPYKPLGKVLHFFL